MDLINMITSIDVTDEGLAVQVRGIGDRVVAAGGRADIVWSLHGFDADPRELWEIPAAIVHAMRLVDFGIVAVLCPSTRVPELLGEGAAARLRGCPAFGGLELWCLASGRLEGGGLRLSAAEGRDLVRRFARDVVPDSRAMLAANLARFPAAKADPSLLLGVDTATGRIIRGEEL